LYKARNQTSSKHDEGITRLDASGDRSSFGCSRDDHLLCIIVIKRETTLRVARPTDRFDEVVHFYAEGLGLTVLGSFEDHEGFDGVMLGVAGAAYHLEFTRKRGHMAGRAPTEDNLLVFYQPDKQVWQAAVDQMMAAGYQPVPAYNPYWDRKGRTYEDPDGYRVVLQNATWSA